MAVSSKILGLAKLQKKLDRMPRIAKEAIRAALAKQADEIVAMMKSLAPEDDGDLIKSIGWTWGKVPKGRRALGGVRVDPLDATAASLGGDLTITIYAGGDDAFYARFVEFGTKASAGQAPSQDRRYKDRVVMTQGKRSHAATPAQPFFYVSWRANRKKAKSAVRRAVTKAAKEVAGSS